MRTTRSSLIKKLSAYLLLSSVAAAQIEEPANNKVFANDRIEVARQRGGDESSSLYRRLEELVIKRLEDLSKLEAKLEARIEAAQSKTSHQAIETSSGPERVTSPVPPVAPVRASVEAERVNIDSFGLIAGDGPNDLESSQTPLLNGSTPDWVKNGIRNAPSDAGEFNFAISSSLLPDVEQCNEDLKSRMIWEVRAYLKRNVLTYENALLPELTQEYVDKYWVIRSQLFDNVQDRPSGTYHQVWVGLHISSEQLSKIRSWEKQSERDQRIKKAGFLGGISLFVVTLLSGAVGLLARRETAKLKG